MRTKPVFDTVALRKLADNIDASRKSLTEVEAHLEGIRRLRVQNGYNILIGGRPVAVAVMDGHTYMAKLVRGREMMHLGALKAISGEVDYWKDKVRSDEKALADAVNGAIA